MLESFPWIVLDVFQGHDTLAQSPRLYRSSLYASIAHCILFVEGSSLVYILSFMFILLPRRAMGTFQESSSPTRSSRLRSTSSCASTISHRTHEILLFIHTLFPWYFLDLFQEFYHHDFVVHHPIYFTLFSIFWHKTPNHSSYACAVTRTCSRYSPRI